MCCLPRTWLSECQGSFAVLLMFSSAMYVQLYICGTLFGFIFFALDILKTVGESSPDTVCIHIRLVYSYEVFWLAFMVFDDVYNSIK